MQSNKHKRDEPLLLGDEAPKRIGPLTVAKEVFEHHGITVRGFMAYPIAAAW